MKKITATELARNLRAVLDRVRESGESYIVERGGQPVVQVTPTPGEQSAEQALADLYRTLSPQARRGLAGRRPPGSSDGSTKNSVIRGLPDRYLHLDRR
jgi:antitoxin (DNA-binding transcriptional repressor) of toxin-antitoxin stability system